MEKRRLRLWKIEGQNCGEKKAKTVEQRSQDCGTKNAKTVAKRRLRLLKKKAKTGKRKAESVEKRRV